VLHVAAGLDLADLIGQQYDEMVKYATALRVGTSDAESILRRFTRTNVQHPTYRALAELGKAERTGFLCRYLRHKELRREIHEGLNVIENWNSANAFIHYGRAGEVATNNREDQETGMLCLHLLQACLVYVNTLMLQQVLSAPAWMDQMGPEELRALTPLIYNHVTTSRRTAPSTSTWKRACPSTVLRATRARQQQPPASWRCKSSELLAYCATLRLVTRMLGQGQKEGHHSLCQLSADGFMAFMPLTITLDAFDEIARLMFMLVGVRRSTRPQCVERRGMGACRVENNGDMDTTALESYHLSIDRGMGACRVKNTMVTWTRLHWKVIIFLLIPPGTGFAVGGWLGGLIGLFLDVMFVVTAKRDRERERVAARIQADSPEIAPPRWRLVWGAVVNSVGWGLLFCAMSAFGPNRCSVDLLVFQREFETPNWFGPLMGFIAGGVFGGMYGWRFAREQWLEKKAKQSSR